MNSKQLIVNDDEAQGQDLYSLPSLIIKNLLLIN